MELKGKAIHALLHEENAKLRMNYLVVWGTKENPKTVPTYKLAIEDLEQARKIYEEIGYNQAEQAVSTKMDKIRNKLEEILAK